MAHSNSQEVHAGEAAPRKQIDLFDPHRATRRSPSGYPPSPSGYPSSPSAGNPVGTSVANSNHVQPFQSPMPHPSGITASKAGGISTFNPVTLMKQGSGVQATQLSSSGTVQSNNQQSSGHPFSPSGSGSQPVGNGVSKDRSSTRKGSAATGMRSLFGGVPKQAASSSRRGSGRKSGVKQGMRSPDFRYLLAGGSLLAGVVLVGDVSTLFQSKTVSDVCQEVVQPDARLSRDDLSKLIAIPERDQKSAVREVVREPYCLLPNIEIRAGQQAEREAYPLAFDPQTWVVLLYEGEEYAGYAFSFKP